MTETERLAAIDAIKQCKFRYCEAVDCKKWDQFREVFTRDAIWDEGGFPVARHPVSGEWVKRGSAFDLDYLESLSAMVDWPVVGPDAIVAAASGAVESLTTFHKVFNPSIEITSDTTARATWPMEDILHWPEGGPLSYMNGMGYYHETYERVDGRWYIKTSKLSRIIVNIA